MKLTVCGSSGTHPSRGRACASYLLEHHGYRLLLDCGNGSLSNLFAVCDVTDVDALLISHLHPDHFADVYGLYYALRFHPTGPARLPAIGPAGAHDFIVQLLRSDSTETFGETLPLRVARAGETLQLGPFEVRLHAARHPVETLAPRITADDVVVAYSADSAVTDDLVDCAADSDLFICDSSWLERQRPLPDGVHMTAAEAGRTAARAGAARLLVTHVFPANDPADAAAEAASQFDGEVRIANDRESITLDG